MDLFAFFLVYFAGFLTAVKMFLTIIYWKEIRSYIKDLIERLEVKWILWKHR